MPSIVLVHHTGRHDYGQCVHLPRVIPTSSDPLHDGPFPTDNRYDYLDTHLGSFKRSMNYWHNSPYGWQSIPWG